MPARVYRKENDKFPSTACRTLNSGRDREQQQQGGSSRSGSSTARFATVNPVNDPVYARIQPQDRFWDGTIRHGFNALAPKHMKGVPFSDLLLPATPTNSNGLHQAVLSSYSCEMSWLYPQFPSPFTVGSGDSAPEQPGIQRPSELTPGWRLLIPELPPRHGVQHMKFMLLAFKHHLRFVLSTGNLQSCDWQAVENIVYIQDFPLKSTASSLLGSANGSPAGDLRLQLDFVLQSFGVPVAHPMRVAFPKYDLDRSNARLVASIPTSVPRKGWDAIRQSGLGRLGHILESFHLHKIPGGHVLEMQGSSTGWYTRHWLKTMHLIASGHHMPSTLPAPVAAVKLASHYERTIDLLTNAPVAQSTAAAAKMIWPRRVKILFPSERFVKQRFILGVGFAGIFYGHKDHFLKNTYKSMFNEQISKRVPTLMHAKSLLALPPDAMTDPSSIINAEGGRPDDVIGWSYVGSHNMTEAAWGNIKGTEDNPESTVKNYELGIVFPITRADLGKPPAQRCFGLQVPIYKHPLEPYKSSDVPWDQFAQG
ncbi:phospholipase D/nuclease [Tilletiaria anomala UBC 951]|uniref:Phospholipase D/nuclease n=1 Tax=Tilletiaria anomala (strain ATCC 24038 / CBS 436.72 / UBC 951) TaxID=1037660 RepID=A0A066W6I3_TILAU|nr:phospholipase D/nuclease [Tilletiaria anomala UBC 951]KDN49587.1 phospholipase D/nuclease [Tilletiaria anomala UBC 951]